MTAAILEHDLPGLLVSLRVAREDAARCVALFTRMREETSATARLLSWDIIRRDCRLGTNVYVMLRFASTRAMLEWKSDPSQLPLMAEIEALALAEITERQARGRNGFFELDTASVPPPPMPPMWKRWTVSMLAVYPALVLLVVVLEPVTTRLPAPFGLFLVALVLTGLNTAFILPWLNKHLQTWLANSKTAIQGKAQLRATCSADCDHDDPDRGQDRR